MNPDGTAAFSEPETRAIRGLAARWYFTSGECVDYMYVTHNTLAFTVEKGTSQPVAATIDIPAIDGQAVASGTYFYKLSAGKTTITKRLILLK